MERIHTQLSEKIQGLKKCPYFTDLDETILSDIAQRMDLHKYERGEVLFWEGEPCVGMHIIAAGSVKLFKVSPQGRELIVRTFDENDFFNEVPVFDHGMNPVSVAALEDSCVWLVPADTIREALIHYPEIAETVLVNVCLQLRGLVDKVEELSFYQVTNRLARLLKETPITQLHGVSAHRLTQDEMAARLGTVREVVARSLRELERSGAIENSRGKIKILDHTILEEWSQIPLN